MFLFHCLDCGAWAICSEAFETVSYMRRHGVFNVEKFNIESFRDFVKDFKPSFLGFEARECESRLDIEARDSFDYPGEVSSVLLHWKLN